MEKPGFSLALVDGDIIAYRCAYATKDKPNTKCATIIDDLMEYCLNETVGFAVEGNYKTYLTGSGNFRYDVAKTHLYKGNRRDTERPEHFEFARQHLVNEWKSVVVDGCEADDAIATEAMLHKEDCVIVSYDKDFHTVPVWKFDFRYGTFCYDDEWSALKYFYTQVLTGDDVDNIKGLWRVGPVKAGKLLAECKTEEELWEACLKAYDGNFERVLENARLLHLRRREDELWSPPNGDCKERSEDG